MQAIYIKDSNKEVLQSMQRAGFNVTSCGDCGEVRLHKTSPRLNELNCESCGLVSDPCDFPDLYTVED